MNDQSTIESDRKLLYRIDERTQLLIGTIAGIKDELHGLRTSIEKRFVSIDEFKIVREKYVSQDEFAPVKMIVYGLVGLIMISVLGAIMILILKQPPTP